MHSEKQQFALLIERSRRAIEQAKILRMKLREADRSSETIRHQGENKAAQPAATTEKIQPLKNGSAQALLSEFAADVAHEVRQPLCAIMSNADAALMLIEAGPPPIDQIREILNDIRSADIRANGAIQGICDSLQQRLNSEKSSRARE